MKSARRTIPLILTALLLAPSAQAELWPTLDDYVSKCVLIFKARTISVGPGDRRTFEVLESWKGQYSAKTLRDTTPEGYFISTQGEHGVKVTKGQEIIFFFTRHNNPEVGPLNRHSTAFPIIKGKVVYGSTSDGLRKEYTVEAFKRAIKRIEKEKQQKDNSEQGAAG